MNVNKRLYKSDDPVVAGVCGGVAEYFELDPTLVRILTVILVLAGFGLPIVAYIIAALVMPKRSDDYPDYIDVKPAAAAAASVPAGSATSAPANPPGPTAASAGPGAPTATGAPASARMPNAAPSAATATSYSAAAAQAAASSPYGAAAPAPGPAPTSPPPPHGAAATTPPPGCAHTACNPQAYDAAGPVGQDHTAAETQQRIRTGIMLGILLVGVGVLALFGTFLDIKAWHCWPLIVVALGFVTLFTPGKKGWSLVRAGHAICLVAIGLALQLWTLGLVTTHAFVLSFLHLWPVILIMLGLFVIGGATGKSVFKLLSSLLFAAALLFGVWSFGSLTNPLRIDLPGVRGIEILLPSPDLSSPESDPAVQSGGLPTR